MEILLVAVAGLFNILCFIVGAKVGQAVSKGEKVEMPKVNPIQEIREAAERKEAKRKQGRIDAILQNIDNYDGTSAGQRDIPGV